MRRLLLGILIIAVVALIVAVLTDFISLKTEGQLRAPTVNIDATGGTLPKVDVDTKEVVVGTTDANIGAPGLGERQVQVPVIGIRDGEDAGQNTAQTPATPPPPPQKAQ